VKRSGFLDRAAMIEATRGWLRQVGLDDLDPTKTIEEISPHEAQLVEIAKVLSGRPCILVMDEPTSALSREEVQRLFEIIRRLKRQGLAVVYISHHLSEIFEVADRVTVLRDGRKIATREIADLTPRSIVQMMIGQTLDAFYRPPQTTLGEPILKLTRLTRYGFFHEISFTLRRGEILGVVGLAGAGRTELARSLCGLDPTHAGSVELAGEPLPAADYPSAVARGLVYLTEDRKNDGLFLRLSVKQNLTSALMARHTKAGFYLGGMDELAARAQMERLAVTASSLETDAGNLSGGNQQKVLLGKWLAMSPKVLVLDEPTRGVDVNAKRRIHEAVLALAGQGAGVLLISSDLPELVGLCDRAVILRNGRLIGEMRREQMSEESLLLAANGQGART